MGTWLSSELGKVKGDEEEERCPTSVTATVTAEKLTRQH